jgi:hypothetical protein
VRCRNLGTLSGGDGGKMVTVHLHKSDIKPIRKCCP